MAKEPEKIEKVKRAHRATYSRDKRKGGYMVRIEGPQCNRFAGRAVPVTMRDGTEHNETLDSLVWTGTDAESGQPVALYTFVPSPKGPDDEIPF